MPILKGTYVRGYKSLLQRQPQASVLEIDLKIHQLRNHVVMSITFTFPEGYSSPFSDQCTDFSQTEGVLNGVASDNVSEPGFAGGAPVSSSEPPVEHSLGCHPESCANPRSCGHHYRM